VDPAALTGKMANSIDSNCELQHLPAEQRFVVRLADEARARGRVITRDGRNGKGT
jgi:predicted RNA-binding protein YlqC (UPF0109 family)